MSQLNAQAVQTALRTAISAKPELEKLKKATDGLESYMFKNLLQTMGGKKGLFGSNIPGGQIYKDMIEQTLSDLMSERGTLGIGKTIFDKVAPNVLNQIQTQQLYKNKLNQSTIEKKA
jgi:Rod binding domain-containing protein